MSICPFCKKDNKCQASQKECWCFTIKVPKDLIGLVPKELKGKSCICKDCILEFKENPQKFKTRYL